LRENPSFSAPVLSRFLRVLQVTGSMVSRGDARRAELAPYMPLFEELVRNGAAVNCEWPCDDYPLSSYQCSWVTRSSPNVCSNSAPTHGRW
jgi:hypothetical protein